MSKMILSLILIAAIAVSWGSGWSPQPSGSGSVPDPLTLDSLNVRSVAVDGNANTIHQGDSVMWVWSASTRTVHIGAEQMLAGPSRYTSTDREVGFV